MTSRRRTPAIRPATLILSLSARRENLAYVRDMLRSFAQALGADRDAIIDMRLAVNEVTSNVVLHAYGDGAGAETMEVEARHRRGKLVVSVTDAGRPGHTTRRPGGETGRGLAIVEALADRLDVRHGEEGIRVEMAFPLRKARGRPSAAAGRQ